jgi:HD-GYP domain-containing protein (c-di-GMP phosphodiesterase class II)
MENGLMKARPLSVFVKRVLLMRLTTVTIVIAATAGSIAYVAQQSRVARQVADFGRQGITTLTRQVADILDARPMPPSEALILALKRSAESPATYRSGRFVWVQFYDRSGKVVAETTLAGIQGIDTGRLAEKWPLTFPDNPQVDVWTRHIGEHRLLVGDVPLTDRLGVVKGYARGAFAVSEAAVAELREAVLRSALIVVAIVCGVTAILYPVILHLTRRLADYSTNLLEANLETLAVLGSAVAKRDADTDAHNYRVSLYALRLGEQVGLGDAEMRGLIKGAFVHDVGKIGIPDAVLLKPGRLDAQEYRIMQTHVDQGVDIVSRASWLRDGVPVVAGHHEKFDGGGYPKGLRAGEIPLVARIFAIADVFDALTSERPYKKPLSLGEALQILEDGRGTHFDPRLLDAFAGISGDLYAELAGQAGHDLRPRLVAAVDRYFAAGMESLRYGEQGSVHRELKGTAKPSVPDGNAQ